MRQSTASLNQFYGTRLGRAAAARMKDRLTDLWGGCEGLNVLGAGYASPILPLWAKEARRCVALQPDSGEPQSLTSKRGQVAVQAPEARFPFAEASFDRVLLLHALEEADSPRAVLREAWRVLSPEGRIVIATTNRRSTWSLTENNAFGHGRPWTRTQLIRFANDSLFQVTASTTAVHLPPLNWPFITAASTAWERAGEMLLPGLGAVVLVEAVKRLYAEPGGSAHATVTSAQPAQQNKKALPRHRASNSQEHTSQIIHIDAHRKADRPKPETDGEWS